jgi:hypothetical protein
VNTGTPRGNLTGGANTGGEDPNVGTGGANTGYQSTANTEDPITLGLQVQEVEVLILTLEAQSLVLQFLFLL